MDDVRNYSPGIIFRALNFNLRSVLSAKTFQHRKFPKLRTVIRLKCHKEEDSRVEKKLGIKRTKYKIVNDVCTYDIYIYIYMDIYEDRHRVC